jgi:hypothetical protein
MMVYNAYQGVIYNDLLKNTNKNCQYRESKKVLSESILLSIFLKTTIYIILSLAMVLEITLFWEEK